MATIVGTGRWTRIANGTFKLGRKETATSDAVTYCNAYAISYIKNSVTYYGVRIANAPALRLAGLQEISIGNAKGYTGEIPMCTEFVMPYGLIWSETDYDINKVKTKFKTCKFICGLLIN